MATVEGITSRGLITLRLQNGQKREVSTKVIQPWWSQNPDLKAKFDLNRVGSTITGEEVADDPEEPLFKHKVKEPPLPELHVPTVVSQPKLPTNGNHMSKFPEPRRTIKKVSASPSIGFGWVKTYEDLEKLTSGIANKQALRDRLDREIREELALIDISIKELEEKGVEIEWE